MELFGMTAEQAMDAVTEWGWVFIIGAVFLGWILSIIREAIWPDKPQKWGREE